MATPRRPLPRAAEELRMNALSLLDDQRLTLKQASAALARGNTALALHFNAESLDKNWSAAQTLRAIPERR